MLSASEAELQLLAGTPLLRRATEAQQVRRRRRPRRRLLLRIPLATPLAAAP